MRFRWELSSGQSSWRNYSAADTNWVHLSPSLSKWVILPLRQTPPNFFWQTKLVQQGIGRTSAEEITEKSLPAFASVIKVLLQKLMFEE